MKTLTFFPAVLLVALTLTGCGRYPSAPSALNDERVVHSAMLTATGDTAVKTTNATSGISKSVAVPFQADGSGTGAAGAAGSMALTINVSGTAQVASLALDVVNGNGPNDDIEATMAIANGVATWQQAQVAAGSFTLKIAALGADGTVLGTATTQADVKTGEPTQVTLDLHVNAAASAGTAATESAPITGVVEPAASAAATVGQIGLDITIQ